MTLRTLGKIVLVACSIAPAAFAQQTPPQPAPQPQPPVTTPVIVEGPAAPTSPSPGTWTAPDKSRKPKVRVCLSVVYPA